MRKGEKVTRSHEAVHRASQPPHERWTASLIGWDSLCAKPSPHLRHAAERAYPIPTTFDEARAEYDDWNHRRAEIEAVLGPENTGDEALDLVAAVRAIVVADVVERDMPVHSLRELYERVRIFREHGFLHDETEAAIFRDLKALAEHEVRRGNA